MVVTLKIPVPLLFRYLASPLPASDPALPSVCFKHGPGNESSCLFLTPSCPRRSRQELRHTVVLDGTFERLHDGHRCLLRVYLDAEQSRRDDLESLGYVLMYFLRGSLPWQGLKAGPRSRNMTKSVRNRCLLPWRYSAKSYPSEFISYFHYCRSLWFEDKPDYSYLKRLFCDLFIREGYLFDYVFAGPF